MEENERLSFALEQLDRIQGLHNRIENRSSVILATNLGMISIIILNLDHQSISWFAAGAMIMNMLAIGLILALSLSHLKNTVQPSDLYFKDIAKQKPSKYISKIKKISHEELIDDALCQIWRNSEIISMKFFKMQLSFIFTCLAALPWLIFLAERMWASGTLPIIAK